MNRLFAALFTMLSALAILGAGAWAELDDAVFRSVFENGLEVCSSTVKGNFGELAVEDFFKKEKLELHSLSPRMGAQGMDHLFVKLDSNNFPRELLVGETKVNTSKPNPCTEDGVQLGKKWSKKRLRKLGAYYKSAARTATECCRAVPKSCTQCVDVIMEDGKVVHFWRESEKSPWNFDGSPRELGVARWRAIKFGKIFSDAGNGKLPFDRLLMHVDLDKYPPVLTISKVERFSNKGKPNAELLCEVELTDEILGAKLSGSSTYSYLRNALRKMGVSGVDLDKITQELCDSLSWDDLVHHKGQVILKPSLNGFQVEPKAAAKAGGTAAKAAGMAGNTMGNAAKAGGLAASRAGRFLRSALHYGGKGLAVAGYVYSAYETSSIVYKWHVMGSVSGRDVLWMAGKMGVNSLAGGLAYLCAATGPVGWIVGGVAMVGASVFMDGLHEGDSEDLRKERLGNFINQLQSPEKEGLLVPFPGM